MTRPRPRLQLLCLIVAVALLPLAKAISPILVKGSKLYTDAGDQFFVKGVAYQPGGAAVATDPLLDSNQCQLDAGLMADIGVNTIRVYTTNTTGDADEHDGCVQAFASQGIYVWVDLASPIDSINRADPEYTEDLFDRFASIIDVFAKYDNILSFTAANELINSPNSTSIAPYIKAVTRDLKAFRDARGYRKIPTSYTSSDVSSIQLQTAEYLTCDDQENAIELYGMNVYSWCGDSSYEQSGYADVYEQFQDVNVPSVFAEVGCTITQPRVFGEVEAILGSVFPAVFSGAIVYSWAESGNGYGLVEYPDDHGTGFPSTSDEYDNLGEVYNSASPVSTAIGDYTPSQSVPSCPSSAPDWQVDPREALPTVRALNLDTVTARTTYVFSSGAPSTAVLAAATASDMGTSTASSAVNNDEGQAALSGGAIAGIAVGGAAVGIIIAAIAFFVLRKRRNARKRNGEKDAPSSREGDGSDSNDFGKAELPASAATPLVPKQEIDGQIVHEAASNPVVYELDQAGKPTPFEMPGSQPEAKEMDGEGKVRYA